MFVYVMCYLSYQAPRIPLNLSEDNFAFAGFEKKSNQLPNLKLFVNSEKLVFQINHGYRRVSSYMLLL